MNIQKIKYIETNNIFIVIQTQEKQIYKKM